MAVARPAFTPGSWDVRYDGETPVVTYEARDVARVELASRDAPYFGDHEANAHLIAAAPDLYVSGLLFAEAHERGHAASVEHDASIETCPRVTCVMYRELRKVLARAVPDE